MGEERVTVVSLNPRNGTWSAATLLAICISMGPAWAVRAPKPEPKSTVNLSEVTQRLDALSEAQRQLAADLGQLRDQVKTLQGGVGDARDEVKQNRDEVQGALDQIKGMREEVRGLYVESSGLKGDIAQVGKQVDTLDGSLGNFRLSAGIVVAIIVVLQIVLIGLMFRGRG